MSKDLSPDRTRLLATAFVALLMAAMPLAGLSVSADPAAMFDDTDREDRGPLGLSPQFQGADYPRRGSPAPPNEETTEIHSVRVTNPLGPGDDWNEVVFAREIGPAGPLFEWDTDAIVGRVPDGWILVRDLSDGDFVHDDCDGPSLPAGAPNCRTLVFRSTEPMFDIRPGQVLDVVIAFELDQNEPVNSANRFWNQRGIPVDVYGVERDDRHYGLDQYFLVIDDGSAPTLSDRRGASAYTMDRDHDGFIDAIHFNFTKLINPESVDLSLIEVGERDSELLEGYRVTGFELPNPAGERISRDEDVLQEEWWIHFPFILLVEENMEWDTGNLPDWEFEQGAMRSFADRVNNDFDEDDAADAAGYVDRAPPVLMSAISFEERHDVHLYFSEGVHVDDGGSRPFNERTDFEYHHSGDNVPCSPQGCEEPRAWVEMNTEPGSTPVGEPDLITSNGDITHVAGEPVVRIDMHPKYTFDRAGEFLQFVYDSASEKWVPNDDPSMIRVSASLGSDKVRDEADNMLWDDPTFFSDPSDNDKPDHVPVSEPWLMQADTDISHPEVNAWFNVPLSTSAGQAARPQHFDVVAGRGLEDGLSGVTGVAHEECLPRAEITLDGNVRPDDVDLDGDRTKVRVVGDQLFACHTIPVPGNADAPLLPVREINIPLVDITPPRIIEALTRDETQNGLIDAYDLKFSEPIDDKSFDQDCLDIRRHPATPVPYELDTTAGALDSGPNDEWVRIKFAESNFDLTGVVPNINVFQTDSCVAFRDLAKSPAVPSQKGNPTPVVAWNHELLEKDGAAPRVMRAQTMDVQGNAGEVGRGMIDGYRVVFTEAVRDSTLQESFVDGPDGVGPAHPDNERLDEWQVGLKGNLTQKGEYDVLDIRTLAHRDDPEALLVFEERPNNLLNPRGDTGHRPDLTYEPRDDRGRLLDFGTIEDLMGNAMRSLASDAIVEEDGAQPVLMAAFGCLGFDFVKVVFSEAVEGASNLTQRSVVTEKDITWQNFAGEAGSATSERSVDHKSGDVFAMMHLHGNLTEDDMDSDRVLPERDELAEDRDQGLIKEVGGKLRTDWMGDRVRVQQAADFTAPEFIDNLDENADRRLAGSVELSWTVPFDFGCTEAGVVDYVIAVSEEPFEREDGRKQDRVPADEVDYSFFNPATERNETESDQSGGLTDEGDTQRALVKRLQPETTYYFRVAGVDEAGNIAEFSNMQEVTTPADLTAPEIPPDFLIESPTHPEDRPSKVPEPEFEWAPAVTDPESGFVDYHFALREETQFTVTQAELNVTDTEEVTVDGDRIAAATGGRDDLRPDFWWQDPAAWNFHLAACSGGGCTPLGSVEILVSSFKTRADMFEHNALLNTNATEKDGTYTVQWDVPDDEFSSSANAPSGVQIWRREAGDEPYTLIAEASTRDAVYQDGRYVDDSGNATKQSRYLVTASLQNDRDDSDVSDDYGYFPANETGALMVNPLDAGAGGNQTYDRLESSVTDLKDTRVVPLWVWILLGVLLLALISGVILFFVLRTSPVEEEWEGEVSEHDVVAADEGTQPEGAPGAAGAAAGAAAGGQVHQVNCPNCKRPFQAQGERPLQITCPHCSASGTLQ